MNASEPFLTHPSVRIKGTENNYDPIHCTDPACPNKTLHMHCPFCMKTDSFQDPVILRAHYRVKHVDKGIDFAGLKILRCCDRCAILGSIKGNKEFKGAHWHCYKCKNGFNRRDEAIKHYRTHFRYPQTTFQIQVTQEVNQSLQRNEIEQAAGSLHPMTVTLDSGMTNSGGALVAVTADNGINVAGVTNGRVGSDNEVHVSVAANETVGTTDGQTIMIIHEESLADTEESTDTTITQQEVMAQEEEIVGECRKKLEALQQRCEQLQEEKSELKTELEQAHLQIQVQQDELTYLRQREQDLMSQLEIPLDDHVVELLNVLKQQHEELLHQQLVQLKKNLIQHQSIITVLKNESVTENFVVGPLSSNDVCNAPTESNETCINYNSGTNTDSAVVISTPTDVDNVSEVDDRVKRKKDDSHNNTEPLQKRKKTNEDTNPVMVTAKQ